MEATLAVTSDAEGFHVTITLDTSEDGQPFVARHWSESIPRDLL